MYMIPSSKERSSGKFWIGGKDVLETPVGQSTDSFGVGRSDESKYAMAAHFAQ